MSDAKGSDRKDAHGMTVGRTASFSDGLFAIAMTLLVLSISEPKGATNAELWRSIRAMWPEAFGYALSFAVIGRYWVAHHGLMRMIRKVTGGFLALTLLFLGVVAFVSIPTGLLGDTSSDGKTFTAAALFYALTLGVLGLSFALLEWFALARNLVYADDREALRFNVMKSLIPPFVFWCSIPLGIAFGGRVAAYSWLLMIPISIIVDRVYNRKSRTEAPA